MTESSTFLEDLEWTVDLLFAGDIYGSLDAVLDYMKRHRVGR